jgi:hypothetical protein
MDGTAWLLLLALVLAPMVNACDRAASSSASSAYSVSALLPAPVDDDWHQSLLRLFGAPTASSSSVPVTPLLRPASASSAIHPVIY